MQIVTHDFAEKDFVAGDAVFNFVNTVNARDAADPQDRLSGYDSLLEWAQMAGVIEKAERSALAKIAAQSPRAAAAALTQAKMIREAVNTCAGALIANRKPDSLSTGALEGAWKDAAKTAQLVAGKQVIDMRCDVATNGAGLVGHRLALAAIELFSDFPSDRARRCPGVRCGWLFIDTSKGGKRVWCDMAVCGNYAKTQRHRRHRKDA